MAEPESDPRRALQLALAGIWLLDAILQFQPYFFTRAFSNEMLRPTAAGNPHPVAHSINWASSIIANHAVSTNTAFALIQLVIALGIACRSTVKPALLLSVGWSLCVWWFGEGLGGILNGGASLLQGGPGAVLLYALLAVLLWPAGQTRRPFVAAGLIGEKAARAVWAVVWGGLAAFSLVGSIRSPDGPSSLISGLADGEPHWLSALDQHVAGFVSGSGLAIAVVLAAVLVVIAARAVVTDELARVAVVAAVVLSLVVWLFAENLGGILGTGATDPNSGPLLALLALAYWPMSRSPKTVPVKDPAVNLRLAASA
jgi:hypothetical protein